MTYRIQEDIESVMIIADYTAEAFAEELGVSRATILNWINNRNMITEKHLKAFYEYTFKKGIRLNKIKEQLYHEDMVKNGEILLFHGAKTKIEGKLSLSHSKKINDFGNGFYCGENLEQSTMFVATYPNSSLYMLKFSPDDLTCCELNVDRDWMLMIAYFRGKLDAYADSEIIKQLIRRIEKADYIIAPIADNRMFEIIDQFIDGEITDIQCQHCLSATNLGKQYVFLTQRALDNVVILERCFLAEAEKKAYLNRRWESFNMNKDKVKLARRQFRNQGQYIEEILE